MIIVVAAGLVGLVLGLALAWLLSAQRLAAVEEMWRMRCEAGQVELRAARSRHRRLEQALRRAEQRRGAAV